MTALLDEAPLTCGPIPLHRWTADMGGRNFTLHIVAQSLAQLRDESGATTAPTPSWATPAPCSCSAASRPPTDLQDISTLCGTRLVAVDDDDNRPLPVFTPADISRIQPGHALVLRNGMRPAVGRAPMVWDRQPTALARAIRWLLAHLARRRAAAGTTGRTAVAYRRAAAHRRRLDRRRASPPAAGPTAADAGRRRPSHDRDPRRSTPPTTSRPRRRSAGRRRRGGRGPRGRCSPSSRSCSPVPTWTSTTRPRSTAPHAGRLGRPTTTAGRRAGEADEGGAA